METRSRALSYIVFSVIGIALIAWLVARHLGKQELLRNLSSEEMQVRVDSAQKLMDMEKLEDSLPAQSIERRSATAEALGEIGTEKALRILGVLLRDQEDAPRLAAREALEKQGHRAVPTLVAALSAGGATTDEAVNALEKLGPSVAPKLRFFLSDAASQPAAATALAKVGGAGTEALIRACYSSDTAGVRYYALTSLGLERVEEAVEACLYNLKPLDTSQQAAGIKALGLIGARRAVPEIIPFLTDELNREYAVTALGQIGDARAANPILATTTATDKRYRNAAILALRRIGRPAIPALVRELRSPEVLKRRAAAAALIGANAPEVTGAVTVALQDEDREVRASAARALGWEGNLAGVNPLVDALSDPAWQVVDAAVEGLGGIGVEAMGMLQNVLSDPNRGVSVRYQVARSLAAMGPAAVEPLVAALSAPEPEVQKWSAVALGEIGLVMPEVIEGLEKLAESGTEELRWVADEQLRHLRRIRAS